MNSPNINPKSPSTENKNLISPQIQQLRRMLTEGTKPSLNLTMKKKVANLLSSRCFEYFIVTLIICYTLIVFVNFGLDDGSTEDDTDIQRTIFGLAVCELVVLVIFTFEIIANIYAYSLKYYFRDRLLLFDAIVILASIILVITDFTITDNSSFTFISKIIRGIFRFFRIFLLFRKVNQFNRIKMAYSRYDVKSPVEKIIEILKNLQENLKKEEEDVKKIAWCIEIISNNKLYDPILENLFKENSNQKEMLNWLANFSVDHQKKKSASQSPGPSESDRKKSSLENDEWRKKRNSILQPSDVPKTQSKILEGILSMQSRNMLQNVDDFDFNVFEFCQIAEGDGLAALMVYLFDENDLFDKLHIDCQVFYSFMKKIQAGYQNNPYHNYIHATDVAQTVNFFLKTCRFAELSDLTYLETGAMYFAACIHDFEHNGKNNAFHIATKTSLAIRYNDKAVLENHHVSAAFILSQKENLRIFENFNKEDYFKFRERVISMVLSTDMSSHFNDLSKVKARLATMDFDLKDKDKNICMDSLIHAADISNPGKPFDLCFQWTERLLQEFWQQGDEERRLDLPISYLMDRNTVNTARSQIGFIDVIVVPTYEVIKAFLPAYQKYIGILEENKGHWKEKIEEYDEKLKLLHEKKSQEEENTSKALMGADRADP